MSDRRAERIEALLARLERDSLDALVVSHPANIRYLTGFSGTSGLLLVSGRGAAFITDFRYETQAAEEIGSLARVVIDGTGVWERLVKLIPDYGARSVGYESHVLSVREADRLAADKLPCHFCPVTDHVEALRAIKSAEEIGSLARVVIDGTGVWERLVKLIPDYGARSVGYEAHVLSVREADRLAADKLPCHFCPVTDHVEALRAIKSAEEVEAIRAAATLAGDALAEAVRQVRAGQTEQEVAAALEGALRRGGTEGYPFPTIVASGPRSALPHARTSSRVIAPGDFLLLDFGAVVDGYVSDVTRTFVVGAAPTARQTEAYALVAAAQRAALTALRAGLSGRQGDALARDVVEAAGQGPAFGHSLGHGIGLEVHEAPRLARTADQVLPAGAVVTVEPGVYYSGWGGVRLEDDVVLTDGGAALLTQFPRELLVLG